MDCNHKITISRRVHEAAARPRVYTDIETRVMSPQSASALMAVFAERERQDLKWGDQRTHPPEKWLMILQEEIGEWSKEVLDKSDPARVREELVQVAAVALVMLESHDLQHGSTT